jgi:6-phosphogluconolactonase
MGRDWLTRRKFMRMAGLASLAGQAKWLPAATRPFQPDAIEQRPKFAFVGVAAQAGGVHVYAIEGERWRLEQFVSSETPVSLALHPSHRTLFVLNEISEFEGLPTGSVEAYELDGKTGQLNLLGRQGLSLSATMPRHMVVAPDGKTLAVAVDGGGAYNLLQILEDGRLGRVCGILKETGSGPVEAHQETAHPQSILFDPTGRRVIAADLGSDRISVISVQDEFEILARHAMPPGSGPRHLALHPDGNLLYVANALDGSLAAFAYDSLSGRISEKRLQMPGQDCRALCMHSSGDFLLTAARDEITAWRIEASTGALEQLHSLETGSNQIREIILVHGGQVIVALTDRGILRIKFDDKSGRIDRPALAASVCGARCFAAV